MKTVIKTKLKIAFFFIIFLNFGLNAQTIQTFTSSCNLLCNTDFENLVWGAGAMIPNSNMPCWKTTASDGLIEGWKNIGTLPYNIPAYSGSQFVELNANVVSTLYQDFNKPSGLTNLVVNCAHRGRNGTDVMNISIGSVGGPYTVIGTCSTGNSAWAYYTNSFTLPSTAGMYSIRFNSISSSGGPTVGNFLDAISVYYSMPAISLITNNITCFNANNGSASLSAAWFSATTSYSWNPVSSTSNSITGLSIGNYTFSINDASLNCKSSGTFAIAQPSPISTTINPIVGCGGSSAILNPTITGGVLPYSYLWSNGVTSQSQTITLSTSSTYSLFVSDLNGCTKSTSVTITTNPSPTISVNSTTICSGATTTLIANGANSYTWSNGASSNSIQIAPLASTQFTIFGSQNGCFGSAISTVIINPQTNVTINNSTICIGASATLIANGANTYSWNTGVISNSTIVNPNTTSQYTVIGTNNDCIGSATSTVLVNQLPSLSVNNASLCLGNSSTLTASGASTYTWSNSSNSNSIIVNPLSTTNYSVYGMDLNGCLNFVSANVLVFSNPTLNCNSNSPVCGNGDINLTANGALSYFWNGPNGFISNAQNPIINNSTLISSGVYTVTSTDANSCTATKTISVLIKAIPTVSISMNKSSGCSPVCISYNFLNNSAISNFQWMANNELLNNSTNALNYCFSNTGVNNISLKINDTAGCSNTIVKNIEVYAKPKADFYFSQNNIDWDENPIVYFTNTSSIDAISYWWHISTTNYTSIDKNPQFLFNEPNIYQTALVVTNQYGCTDTTIKTLTVNDNFGIYIPNTFTPNTDGLNDTFKPKGTGFIDFQMDIFNKWGEKIFSTVAFDIGWDGQFKNSLVKEDVYVYKIKVKNRKGKVQDFTGTVTVLY